MTISYQTVERHVRDGMERALTPGGLEGRVTLLETRVRLLEARMDRLEEVAERRFLWTLGLQLMVLMVLVGILLGLALAR